MHPLLLFVKIGESQTQVMGPGLIKTSCKYHWYLYIKIEEHKTMKSGNFLFELNYMMKFIRRVTKVSTWLLFREDLWTGMIIVFWFLILIILYISDTNNYRQFESDHWQILEAYRERFKSLARVSLEWLGEKKIICTSVWKRTRVWRIFHKT